MAYRLYLRSIDMERTIGDPGEFLNNSMASRAVNIEPNMRKVRQLDIYHQNYSKLLRGWGLAGLGLLAVGVALWYFHHQIWGSLFGVLALPVLFIASRLPQTLKGDAYRNGLLIPGIISNLNPLTITCLTDIRAGDDSDEVLWGVKEVVVPKLTVHPERLGEQVPCVSLFGETNPQGDHYTNLEPRPLAWGTDDDRIIAQARQAIDEEEWFLLPQLAVAYGSSDKSHNGIAFFDADLQPIALAKPAETTE